MTLDAEVAAHLADVAAAIPPAAAGSAYARRARLEAVARRFPYPADDVRRDDHWLHLPGRELLVRVYRPAPGTLPAILYLHGGGWVAGSVASHDGPCAALAADAGVVVASVQYRRAPENPFPAPNDDAFAALEWLARTAAELDVDATRIAVAGDSAGAHLALGAALDARAGGGPALALQVLVYPVADRDFETASYRAHAVSPTLTRADMIEYWAHYLPEGDAAGDARAVPLRADLHGLPPACIVVAGLDPLYDEGVALAGRLRQADVPAVLMDEPTLVHGFLRMAPYAKRARAAQRAMGEWVGRALLERTPMEPR
ncbi:MAG: alpha/beta hydrolase [Burkholderiales bacterium]